MSLKGKAIDQCNKSACPIDGRTPVVRVLSGIVRSPNRKTLKSRGLTAYGHDSADKGVIEAMEQEAVLISVWSLYCWDCGRKNEHGLRIYRC